MQNNKYLYWGVGAVIVLGVILAVTWPKNDESNQPSPTPAAVSETPGVDETPEEPAQPTATAKLTYTQAIQIYGDTGSRYRFQFNDCMIRPGQLTIKQGGKLMLDNRDNAKRKITVGKQTFNLGAYGFVVMTASELGNLKVTCDGTARAELLVQK